MNRILVVSLLLPVSVVRDVAIGAFNDGKKHEVIYRAAETYLKTYPKVEMLARFVAVEKKRAELSDKVAKGK